jgi:hypothetical protein
MPIKRPVIAITAVSVVTIFGLLIASLLHDFLLFSSATRVSAPPYPPSQIIESIVWDFDSLTRAAHGSDLFPLTWADDDNLYTAWGDGWGFSESGAKKSLGVSKVSGMPSSLNGTDLWSGVGKCNGGIICIDGVLYMFVTEQDEWKRAKVGRSNDHGISWDFTEWIIDEPGGAFASPGLLQFGKDYQGARDEYVYGYNHKGGNEIELFMFRVLKNQLMNRGAYEFFSGVDEEGNPSWSADVNQKYPVFVDHNGVGWGVNAVYHPVLNRYLLTVRHDSSGGWGIFDAPEPWGPWTTAAYYNNWIDSEFKFTFSFPRKWMSSDGKTMWMVFSGTGDYDAFNAIKATLTFKISS